MNNVGLEWITPNAEKRIMYMARVSNPKNQDSDNVGLLKYLIKHKHWSPFEMVNACFEIDTTRDIARQILRHRSFSFQEFCMSEDTEVYFDLPNAVKKGKRQLYKLTLKQLYNKWNKNNFSKSQITNMYARVYDCENNKFSHAHIKEVFKTGIKDIYEIELENGKKFKSTKEHKVLTNKGFVSLEKGFGLNKTSTDKAFITSSNLFIGCNGIPCYQDYNWLYETKQESFDYNGVHYIANKAGVSYHTIRKWLKIHGLQFSKLEVAKYTEAWNKGKTGYKNKPHSIETIKKMKASARKGEKSNLWKGGVSRSERQKIADWCNSIRAEKLIEYNYNCTKCGSNNKLELHHKLPVYSHPKQAYNFNNIEVLCKNCHSTIHKINGDYKTWKEKSKGNILVPRWAKIKKVVYLGKQQTYDLHMDHESHNYIANGVVVHNSQRYADPTLMAHTIKETRLQDDKNRQNSLPNESIELDQWWQTAQSSLWQHSLQTYNNAVNEGIAKEVARSVLPEGMTRSRMYMNGTIRSWIHYVQLRTDPSTQKEHRHIANEINYVLSRELPNVWAALEE